MGFGNSRKAEDILGSQGRKRMRIELMHRILITWEEVGAAAWKEEWAKYMSKAQEEAGPAGRDCGAKVSGDQ